jgi:hypothetical protein
MDALEVLEIAKREYGIDPNKVYLTGHSMGGHGTWILGATFPQLFSALAPSAGWRSFFTYGGKPVETGSELIDFIGTASNTSATHLLFDNYKNQEIYVIHGDADDNVPVSEARAMKKVFEDMKKPIGYHEQPGAGHWWDGDKSAGADCVDWPPIFEMFQKAPTLFRNRAGTPRAYIQPPVPQANMMESSFVTVNPAVSSGYPGLEILRQEKKLRPSSIQVASTRQGMEIKTVNAETIKLSGSFLGPMKATIDAQPITVTSTPTAFVTFTKTNGKWEVARDPRPQVGPFKEAFTNRLAFVYGTKGTAEENAWMYNKARYDAEQLWYRGNGGAELLSDEEAMSAKGRNLVVYGNSRINKIWDELVGKAPLEPDIDQGILMLRPQAGRLIACIGGEGLKGMRATDRLPIFVSGVGYPDWVIFGTDIAAKGNAAVLGAGYWNHDGQFGETVRR